MLLKNKGSRSWGCAGLLWLLCLGWTAAVAQPASRPPAARRVLALLGPLPSTAPEQLAAIRRVQQQRPAWRADPLSRLLVYYWLTQNYQRLRQPDSTYHYLLRARREGQRPALRQRYPLDVSGVLELLAQHHWATLQLDSAGYYYRASAELLAHSGFDLYRRADVQPLLGGSFVVGRALASRLANAGLVYRRRGELVAATQLYEQALHLLEAHRALPGLCWVQCLLGEAYEDQGNDRRARPYYQQAFGTVRTIARENPIEAAGEFVDVLDYYHDLLLRGRAYASYAALVREALPVMQWAERSSPSDGALPEHIGAAYLLQATFYLQTQPPDSVRAALARADAALNRCRALSKAGLTEEYHNRRLIEWCLHLELAHREGDRAAQRAWQQRALAALPAMPTPSRQASAREQLGRCLTDVGEYALAARVLRPLEALYHRQGARLKTRDLLQLLERAYAGRGLTDSAYHYARQYQRLSDTLRATDQYAALAAVETRYRTREKERQIGDLTARAAQQRRAQHLSWLGALLLALLLGGTAWALRYTRRLNRRLAELDQLKTQFFANVSHELRTPLTLIVGPVEQLLQQPDGMSAEARRQLALTLRNGQRLQQLVNGLLDLTKLEAGKLHLQPAPERLGPRLRQLIDSFESLAHYQRITLTLADELPADLILRLDAQKLEQILSNLLSNALKFTPAGGRVTLEAAAAGPGRWRLTVRDTGPGIAPDEQARVFERFYQTRQRQAQGGTGIGLTFSRELAELMGGALTLASTPGLGSAFTLTFPAEQLPASGEESMAVSADAEEPETAAAAVLITDAASQPPRKARVLVVEDHADLRAYLRQILVPRYDVLEAENGQRALEILARESVDLISSDEMMPLLSGTELLLSLKGQARWRRVPFLMLTARTDVQHRFRALELGVDDYLQKPFAPRELLARIHNLLVNYRERLEFGRAEEPGAEIKMPHAPGPARAVGPEQRGAASEEDNARGAPEGENPLAVAEERAALDQELLYRLRSIAEGAMADPAFDVLQLGLQLNLSERTLYRKLKELTGLTPAAYLREVRLEHARYLLETRATATVADVAYAVGFEDPSYFGKVFLKRYGKRPGEYR